MKRIALLVLICLSVLPGHALAWTHGFPGSTQCIKTQDNGCAAALSAQIGSPAASVYYGPAGLNPGAEANLLADTPTNYAVNGPDRNLPLFNYPVGVTTASASLDDPSLIGIIPGCVYDPNGNASNGPQVICTHPAVDGQVVSGYEFGSTGGHGCTSLSVRGTPGGAITTTFSQDDFRNDTGDCATVSESGVVQLQVDDNTQLVTGAVELYDHDSWFGNADIFPNFDGPNPNCNIPGQRIGCNPSSQAFIVAANTTFQYDYFDKYFARAFQYNSLNTNPDIGLIFRYSAMVGCCFYYPALHGELFEFAGSGPFLVYGNSLINTPQHNTDQ